ncbi:MAG: Asp-tRNA(Asn)/Glu-tRNA(Gln) amidotransferase subunit GatB [Pseudomonadota bacterium]
MSAGWETVIGLEVHVQLATSSKIFSGTSTAYGAAPNGQASIIDLGMPGVLPVLNEEAVRMAITFGLAIGAEIQPVSIFDRKNYFYPDLPKGYQISQFEAPVVGRGNITVALDDGTSCEVGITRAHLEEDAGKSVHDAFPNRSGIDLNRTGTPLLEVVSEPDMRSAAQASAYFRQLHALVRYLRICDGNLNEGSMRCDVNVSVRRHGETEFGQRTEIKNVNSFKFVERAIEVESERHIEILEAGGTIERETRLFDPERDETRAMRGKELSDDYRYFPDPDLLPLHIEPAWIDEIRTTLPELPDARRARFETEFGLSAQDADSITRDPDTADYFEAVTAACGAPKLAANWINGELAAALNKSEQSLADCALPPASLGLVIERIEDGTLSSKTAKTVFELLWETPEAGVDDIIESRGLKQVNDSAELGRIVAEVVAANPAQAEQFRAGKDKVLGFFVGQIMKATQGKANPQQVNELLRAALSGD